MGDSKINIDDVAVATEIIGSLIFLMQRVHALMVVGREGGDEVKKANAVAMRKLATNELEGLKQKIEGKWGPINET